MVAGELDRRDPPYVACLRGTRLYRFQIAGDTLTNPQRHLEGAHGRLRTVEPTADGDLWLTTSNEGDEDSIPGNCNEHVLEVTLGSGNP
ncbi:PQQ-dependent sugar dehydrogenase [Saccharothrix sp. NEAU-S10]|nr:PQQ-dependent sugar dehydrogenase [Saccharothrix luteola]